MSFGTSPLRFSSLQISMVQLVVALFGPLCRVVTTVCGPPSFERSNLWLVLPSFPPVATIAAQSSVAAANDGDERSAMATTERSVVGEDVCEDGEPEESAGRSIMVKGFAFTWPRSSAVIVDSCGGQRSTLRKF